jgi:hypothetical protein
MLFLPEWLKTKAEDNTPVLAIEALTISISILAHNLQIVQVFDDRFALPNQLGCPLHRVEFHNGLVHD